MSSDEFDLYNKLWKLYIAAENKGSVRMGAIPRDEPLEKQYFDEAESLIKEICEEFGYEHEF
jgi:hypothetical protein